MRAIVFAGPSISRKEVEGLPGAEWRPPVSQGDVYRAAQTAPDIIAIIDGYFDGVPSVWHKEILWAMSRGIHLLGASSMGALRAAELHQFGMRGVGEIFESFRDGVLEDDDEVAVLHGPAELNYPPLSLAMVNARKTIAAAVQASIIDHSVGETLVSLAKSIFYQQRQWAEVIALARKSGVDADSLTAFESWLEHGAQDLKLQDARALLAGLSEMMDSGQQPFQSDYSFSWTVMWDSLVAGHTGRSSVESNDQQAGLESLILDELRFDPKLYRKINTRARLKQVALHQAGRKGIEADEAQTRRQLQQLQETHGLYTRAQLDGWMKGNDWNPDALQQALESEQRCKTVIDKLGNVESRVLLNELRLQGDYAELKKRAQARREADLSPLAGIEIKPPQLLAWYFESQLGESIPADLDQYLSETGFRDRDEFYQLLQRHYLTSLALDAEKQ